MKSKHTPFFRRCLWGGGKLLLLSLLIMYLSHQDVQAGASAGSSAVVYADLLALAMAVFGGTLAVLGHLHDSLLRHLQGTDTPEEP